LTVLRVHNAFKQFSPWPHIYVPLGFMYFRKALSYFIREMIFHRSVYYFKKINSKIHFSTFLSESITEYAISKKLVAREKVMFPLPLLPYEPDGLIKPKDKIVIAIVGAVEKRKKNYEPVVEAFSRLFNHGEKYPVPVELHFLGIAAGSYGDKITGQLKAIPTNQFSFFYYPDDVPVDLFDATLNRAQIIISPLRVKNVTQVFGEIYGKTKFTASVGVVIKHKLIGLFPADFTFDPDMESHLKKYSSGQELGQILHDYITNPSLLSESRERLIQFLSERYSQEKILLQLEEFIDKNVVQ
jgi:glycosyltransferase involved in cell wall biosynthesis